MKWSHVNFKRDAKINLLTLLLPRIGIIGIIAAIVVPWLKRHGWL